MEAYLYIEMQYFSLITFSVVETALLPQLTEDSMGQSVKSMVKSMSGSEPKAGDTVRIPKCLYVCSSLFSNKIVQRI